MAVGIVVEKTVVPMETYTSLATMAYYQWFLAKASVKGWMELEVKCEENNVVKEVHMALHRKGNENDGKFYKCTWKMPIPSKLRDSYGERLIMEFKQWTIWGRDTSFPVACVLLVFSVKKKVEESMNHLLFEWRFSHYIWTQCYSWYKEGRLLPTCYQDHFHFWQYTGLVSRKKS